MVYFQFSAVIYALTITFVQSADTSNLDDLEELLPPLSVCGLQHSDDYFHTVNGTVVTDFPWVALVEYRLKNDSTAYPPEGKYQCSGSLINQYYVLTAAQCLTHPTHKPVTVRLGEYHMKNQTDCVEDANVYECADAAKDFTIERIIPHPDANNEDNDVGLIKLKTKVIFSDYIRPICLPLPGVKPIKVGRTLTTTGWGKKKLYTDDYVEIKKITSSTLISIEECSEMYNELGITIGEHLMCGLLSNTSDSVCFGDAGGPVMFTRKRRWYQVAIVSFGKECKGRYPEVFTEVKFYLDWIAENIK